MDSIMINYIIVLLSLYTITINGDCWKYESCKSCLINGCSWCSSNKYSLNGYYQCDHLDSLKYYGCEEKYLHSPSYTIKYQSNLTNNNDNNGADVIYRKAVINPTKVHAFLWPNKPINITFEYSKAKNYPVDLYVLMDLSYTMIKHKNEISSIAHKLQQQMSKITSNFRLGFGSFIDKTLMPYTDMLPKFLKNPCRTYDCASPYGFRHHLSLTSNISLFMQAVNSSKMSGNLDNAEGGLDGLVQVIVCPEIGWSLDARKMILFVTDSLCHYAGDGILGGVVKPNDLKCHLDENGFYSKSTHNDYPSIGQINELVTSNKINIIFASPESSLKEYKILSSIIDSCVAAKLDEDSDNVLTMIEENYQKIDAFVKFDDNLQIYSEKNTIKTEYFIQCPGEKAIKRGKSCDNVAPGTKLYFTLQITVKNCTKDTSFTLSPSGIPLYSTINLSPTCECNCTKMDNVCENNGEYHCGQCKCKPRYFGKKCECIAEDVNESMQLCHKNDSNVICSNRGICNCGSCLCLSQFFGKYCECDKFSCPRGLNGFVCSNHGHCCNSKCSCFDNWSGPACECALSELKCIDPYNNQVCNNNGECICGRCLCNQNRKGKGVYIGQYCSECIGCRMNCSELISCIECRSYGRGIFEQQTCYKQCPYKFIESSNVVNISKEYSKCTITEENGCQTNFYYGPDYNGDISLILDNNKACPNQINLLNVMIFIIGLTLILGLIGIIVFKCYRDYEDKQQYLEWLKTKDENVVEFTNDIYKSPISKYENVYYTKIKDSNIDNDD